MSRIENSPLWCLFLFLILCPKYYFTRRLEGSRIHQWNPPVINSHIRSAPNYYPTAGKHTLAARAMDIDEDARVTDDTVDIGGDERALGGIYGPIPYQAGILHYKHFRCGATFVTVNNLYFFLTAATCVVRHFGDSYSPDKIKDFEIFVGADNVRNIDASLKYKPDKIVVHPCYSPATKVGNLAIIFVRDFVHQIPGKIHAARLPLEEGYPFPIDIKASGFGGENRYNEYYGILNTVDIGAWDQSFCRNFGWQPGFFCVVDMQPARPRGICQGDEGGPVVGEYEVDFGENFEYVAGIISHVANGLPCQEKGKPSMITQLSLYLPWILEETNERHDPSRTKPCVPVDCSKTEC